ncbi:minor capsid protein [Eubacteriales bacterium OttesenSCG-928-K08]|nr:minor capsid protein [Eubacteriales bacterium OttesenSCG-928-K08]
MASPMPIFLLPHSCTHLYGEKTSDEWGNETYSNSQELTRVRFEPSSKLVKTRDNQEVQLSMLCFFDCVNSTPQGWRFHLAESVGDGIVWDGMPFEIATIDAIYTAQTLHHYELGLI